jgi:hypothetical protein
MSDPPDVPSSPTGGAPPTKKRWTRTTLLVLVGAGLLTSCCCGGVIAFRGEEVPVESTEKKTTLTHAERVMLAAEKMHEANIRARPEDDINRQMVVAAFGEKTLKAPRRDLDCEWRLAAFDDRRCFLRVKAVGDWSPKAARFVVNEFNRFAPTLCPTAIRDVAEMVHAVGRDRPHQRQAGAHNARVTLQHQHADGGQWEVMIELWPLTD